MSVWVDRNFFPGNDLLKIWLNAIPSLRILFYSKYNEKHTKSISFELNHLNFISSMQYLAFQNNLVYVPDVLKLQRILVSTLSQYHSITPYYRTWIEDCETPISLNRSRGLCCYAGSTASLCGWHLRITLLTQVGLFLKEDNIPEFQRKGL